VSLEIPGDNSVALNLACLQVWADMGAYTRRRSRMLYHPRSFWTHSR